MAQKQKSSRREVAEKRIGDGLIRIEQHADAAAKKIATLETALADHEITATKLGESDGKIATLQKENSQLRDQVAMAHASGNQGAEILQGLEETIATLKTALAEKTAAVEALTDERAQLKRDGVATLKDVDKIVTRVETIAEQVNG